MWHILKYSLKGNIIDVQVDKIELDAQVENKKPITIKSKFWNYTPETFRASKFKSDYTDYLLLFNPIADGSSTFYHLIECAEKEIINIVSENYQYQLDFLFVKIQEATDDYTLQNEHKEKRLKELHQLVD